MSKSIAGGNSIDLPIDAGKSIKLGWLGGTYSVKIVAGAASLPVALATDSASDASFGPYSNGVILRVSTSALGRVEYDVATTPEFHPAGLSYVRQSDGISVKLSGLGPTAAFSADGGGSSSSGLYPVSSRYLAMFPGDGVSPAGIPRDLSRNLIGLYPMSTYTEAEWRTVPDRISTLAGTNKGMAIPQSQMDLSTTDDTDIILFFNILKAQPAAEEPILGWGAEQTGGLCLYARTNGQLRMAMRCYNATLGTVTLVNQSVYTGFKVVADGTEKGVLIRINTRLQSVEQYVNKQYSGGLSFGATADKRRILQTAAFGLGAASGADGTTYPAQFRNLHILRVPAGAPLNVAAMYSLFNNPSTPLHQGDI